MTSHEDLELLEQIRSPQKDIAPDNTIYYQSDTPGAAFILVSGWAYLHQTLANGRRQIIRFLLPGDIFGAEHPAQRMSHGAEALTRTTLCTIPAAALEDLGRRHAEFHNRRLWMVVRNEELAMTSVTALGQRSSRERICHLMLELVVRKTRGPPVDGAPLKTPLTQSLIGDALGLTAIHVNRTLRRLSDEGILEFRRGVLTIVDSAAAARLADISEGSLEMWMDRPQQEPAWTPRLAC